MKNEPSVSSADLRHALSMIAAADEDRGDVSYEVCEGLVVFRDDHDRVVAWMQTREFEKLRKLDV